jgi:hypothetical protein
VDNAPAENQLCKIPGRDVFPVSKDGNGVNPGLLLDAEFELFHHMFT